MKKTILETITKFREYLINEEKSQATAEKYVHDINAMYKWAKNREINKPNRKRRFFRYITFRFRKFV